MTVRWSPSAEADLQAAIDYLAHEDPAAAAHLMNGIREAVELLTDGRFEGPKAHLAGKPVRSWLVRPFRLYYQRRDDVLLILRVYHERRKPLS